jgi:hypothetical protein
MVFAECTHPSTFHLRHAVKGIWVRRGAPRAAALLNLLAVLISENLSPQLGNFPLHVWGPLEWRASHCAPQEVPGALTMLTRHAERLGTDAIWELLQVCGACAASAHMRVYVDMLMRMYVDMLCFLDGQGGGSCAGQKAVGCSS